MTAEVRKLQITRRLIFHLSSLRVVLGTEGWISENSLSFSLHSLGASFAPSGNRRRENLPPHPSASPRSLETAQIADPEYCFPMALFRPIVGSKVKLKP